MPVTFTASDFKGKLTRIFMAAAKEPVTITRRGADDFILLTRAEYQRERAWNEYQSFMQNMRDKNKDVAPFTEEDDELIARAIKETRTETKASL